jgi:hypothetical protein
MWKPLCLAAFVFMPTYLAALDFEDFDAVCTQTAEATQQSEPDEFHTICTCAYGVIAQEIGTELTVIYARFELADDTLDAMLPDEMSTEQFFALLGETGPAIDAACTP